MGAQELPPCVPVPHAMALCRDVSCDAMRRPNCWATCRHRRHCSRDPPGCRCCTASATLTLPSSFAPSWLQSPTRGQCSLVQPLIYMYMYERTYTHIHARTHAYIYVHTHTSQLYFVVILEILPLFSEKNANGYTATNNCLKGVKKKNQGTASNYTSKYLPLKYIFLMEK